MRVFSLENHSQNVEIFATDLACISIKNILVENIFNNAAFGPNLVQPLAAFR